MHHNHLMGRRRQPPSTSAEVDLGRATLQADPDSSSGQLLMIDGTQQSHVDLDDPTNLQFEYMRWIGHVCDLAPPGPLVALHLGGGALTLPRYLRATRPGTQSTVIEIDARLVAFVREQLPWPPGIRVRIGDARAALEAAQPQAYDLVVSDVFAAARTPGPVTTHQFVAAALRALRPGGAFVANIADEAPFRFARRYLAAVTACAQDVVLMVDPGTWRGRRFGNFVVVAGPVDADELARRTRSDPWPARVVADQAVRDFVSGAAPYDDSDAPGSPEPPAGVFGPANANC